MLSQAEFDDKVANLGCLHGVHVRSSASTRRLGIWVLLFIALAAPGGSPGEYWKDIK